MQKRKRAPPRVCPVVGGAAAPPQGGEGTQQANHEALSWQRCSKFDLFYHFMEARFKEHTGFRFSFVVLTILAMSIYKKISVTPSVTNLRVNGNLTNRYF